MPTDLWDLLPAAPLPHEANVIPFFDGCDRTVIQIPAGITCQDVLSCIDCTFIGGLFDFSSPSLIWDPIHCELQVNPFRVNNVIQISFDCVTYILTLGNGVGTYQIVDLNCLFNNVFFTFIDGSGNQIVYNHDIVTINGRDGLGFWIGNGGLNVSLPNPRINGQVLTWNGTTNQAYWANPIDVCCDWVYSCMEPIIASLQNQINIIAQQLCPCGEGSGGAYIDIYEEGVLVHASVAQLNFIGDCVTAVRNPSTNQADITIDPTLLWGGCTGPNAYILSLCGSSVDLSCLGGHALAVENTVFVMKNGSDITGTLERFDLPFLTIQAAIDAAYADFLVTGQNRTVIVYNGRYMERIELKNMVDVEFHRGTTIIGIDVILQEVRSKVTGHANIELPTSTDPTPWSNNAIFVQQTSSSSWVEIDVDKIYSIGGSSAGTLYIARTMAPRARMRLRVGSLEQKSTCEALVVLFTCLGGSSIDGTIIMWNEIAPVHQFYDVEEDSELYRHHSNIVGGPFQIFPIINTCSGPGSRVYVDNIYIKGCYSLPCPGATRRQTIGAATLTINDLLMDLDDIYAVPGAANKIFGTYVGEPLLTGEVKFYGMTQISGSVAWTDCIIGEAQSYNIYGRLLTNLLVSVPALLYYIFNTINNYEVQTQIPIPVRMSAYTGYANA